MNNLEIIQEYYDAEHEYRQAFAAEASKDEYVALPEDVRVARVQIVIADQSERLTKARTAVENTKADREERLIAAYEAMGLTRQLGSNS